MYFSFDYEIYMFSPQLQANCWASWEKREKGFPTMRKSRSRTISYLWLWCIIQEEDPLTDPIMACPYKTGSHCKLIEQEKVKDVLHKDFEWNKNLQCLEDAIAWSKTLWQLDWTVNMRKFVRLKYSHTSETHWRYHTNNMKGVWREN